MKVLLYVAAIVVGAFLVWVKYAQARDAHTHDLGDGGVQKLFGEDSK